MTPKHTEKTLIELAKGFSLKNNCLAIDVEPFPALLFKSIQAQSISINQAVDSIEVTYYIDSFFISISGRNLVWSLTIKYSVHGQYLDSTEQGNSYFYAQELKGIILEKMLAACKVQNDILKEKRLHA